MQVCDHQPGTATTITVMISNSRNKKSNPGINFFGFSWPGPIPAFGGKSAKKIKNPFEVEAVANKNAKP